MDAFVETHAALILRFARMHVRPTEAIDPSDVAQEVVESLLRARRAGTFDESAIDNVEAYLRTAVRNAAHRARARGPRAGALGIDADVAENATDAHDATPVPSPEDLTGRAEEARRTIEALKARLRPRDAVAFAMLVEDEMSIDDVAAALGTTHNNVYQMRHRILAEARAFLGKEDDASALDRTKETRT